MSLPQQVLFCTIDLDFPQALDMGIRKITINDVILDFISVCAVRTFDPAVCVHFW